MITRMIPASLAGHGKIPAELAWDPKCPIEVRAHLTDPHSLEVMVWCLSLETLRMGAVTVSPNYIGRGDVQITTDGPHVTLWLRSPEGTADIRMDYAATREFLDAVTLANLNEEAAMLALVDAFLVTLNEEAF